MSSGTDPLRDLLESFESEGQRSDEGSFTLEPHRATEILRAQGRLGQNAPLYLLSAIHQHTDGQPIERAVNSRDYRLNWNSSHGPLPPTLEREVAEQSFAAHEVHLVFGDSGVSLKPARLVDPLFRQVAERLDDYPFIGSIRPNTEVLGRGQCETASLVVTRAGQPAPRFIHIVRGIAYPKRWSLPVDTHCFDPGGRPDLTLTVIPDSARADRLVSAAEALFQDILRQSLGQATAPLDPFVHKDNLPLYAIYLAYAISQTADPELAEVAAAKVSFMDATGREWTARELREVYSREGKLMIVPSLPEPEVPTGQRSDRPVLLWGGQAQEIGEQLFPIVTSGAGYLYSLSVNEKEKQRVGEPRLASKTVEGGRLSLLSWGDPDRPAELEFVGPRRARETFHLDSDAPKGLRLLWESEQSLEEYLRELALEGPLRHVVLELIDVSLRTFTPSRETLLTALSWALSKTPLDWSLLPGLAGVPLLFDVRDELVSVAQLMEWKSEHGRLPVLLDRSSSLPRLLPVQPLVWWHPLLKSLEIPTEDAGRQVREAHWQETGRERWLAAHPPAEPDWPPAAREFGPHRAALSANPNTPTEVAFWREGRPFGRRTLSPDQCPSGCLVMWIEDSLPGDTYWSGPEPAALQERLPAIAQLCGNLKAARPPSGTSNAKVPSDEPSQG